MVKRGMVRDNQEKYARGDVTMTERLERSIARLKTLPTDKQDAIASSTSLNLLLVCQ